MNFNQSRLSLLAIPLMLLMAATPLSLQAAEDESDSHKTDDAGKLYLPSEDAMGDLQATLQKAEDENKMALVILGANWSNDSRALAARLQVEPLKSLVDENYVTLFVNVGNLSEGREVIQSLGVPIYYATPTVLIIDPVTGALVNEGNRHMWASADSISMEDSVDYFEQIAGIDLSTLPDADNYTAEQAQLMADIDAFEQVQADRLIEAYVITGAMLDKDFDKAVWKEVGQYRYSVATDVDALRAEVSQRIADGETEIVLVYPSYPPWSWNVEAETDDQQ